MPEEEPQEKMQSQPAPPSDAPLEPAREQSRRKALTPEQRRLLGTPRSLHGRPETEKKDAEMEPAGEIEKTKPEPPRQAKPPAAGATPAGEQLPAPEPSSEERKPTRPMAAILPDRKSSRALEMQNAALIIGALFLLCLTFYAGKKFEYWKYMIMTRTKAKPAATAPDKFPGISADDLIEQALVAERSGQFKEAVEKLLAAKQKNLRYRGILFRAGKIAYDHGDFDSADKIFERALAFGENIDTANYFRGLVAIRRRDLAAAERFFQAAANAGPFASDYYYYWAEALRMGRHPKEAIPHYERAARRARNEGDEAVCRFKVRMARLEAGETPQLSGEVEQNRSRGPLSVDWLMTAAALKIREGDINEAVRLISEARAGHRPGLFASCATDMVFQDAGQKYPDLAQACRVETGSR
jgi:tetratricopeptide (TPR) repeat protein